MYRTEVLMMDGIFVLPGVYATLHDAVASGKDFYRLDDDCRGWRVRDEAGRIVESSGSALASTC